MTENPERRHWQRNRPQQLVYVELEPGNGGMVLNISEEGFSFRAVNPVRTNGAIRFVFDIDGKRRLEGAGELEWAEENGKVCGLRFTDISQELRGEIRRWLTKPQPPAAMQTPVLPAPVDTQEKPHSELKAEPPEAQPLERPDGTPGMKIETPPTALASAHTVEKPNWTEGVRPRKLRVQTPPVQAPAPPKMLLPAASEVEEKNSLLALPAELNVEKSDLEKETAPSPTLPVKDIQPAQAVPGQMKPKMPEVSAVDKAFPAAAERREEPALWLNAIEREKSKKLATADESQPDSLPRPGLNRAAAVAIVVATVLVVLSGGVFSYRRAVGESLIWLGEKLAGETRRVEPRHSLPLATPPAPAAPLISSPATSPSQSLPADTGANPALAREPLIQGSPNTPANISNLTAPATAPEEPGQAELAAAQRILGSKTGSRNITGAMKLLWLAVQKGNSTAVLTLSELYVRGQVVTKNCAQARVLLTAAAKKGNAEAGARLAQLRQQGCP